MRQLPQQRNRPSLRPEKTATFWSGVRLLTLLTGLRDLNRKLGCRDFILPGLLATVINDDWIHQQSAALQLATTTLEGTLPLRMTLALGEDAAGNLAMPARIPATRDDQEQQLADRFLPKLHLPRPDALLCASGERSLLGEALH